MRAASGLIAGVLVAALSTVAVAATWDMPTPYPDTTFHTVNIKQFADDVKASTNGKLQIKIHSAGSLFKHPEIKNAVRGGQVPIGEFLLSTLSNENAVFQVDSVPFLATDYDQAKKLWEASRGSVERLLEGEGVQVLYAVPWPPQGLFVVKSIASVDDLKGLKFRAYNPATEQLAQLIGAVPTQVEVADLPQAFATGRVQAMITSPVTGADSKAWDYVSHYYHTQAWLPKNVVVVNRRIFRALDEETRTAVLNAAIQAQNRGWQMSAAETNEKLALLAKNGMRVDEPSAELRAGLRKFGEKMTEDWVKRAGPDGQAILSAFRAN